MARPVRIHEPSAPRRSGRVFDLTRMRDTALFLLAVFSSTGLVEFCVLRRWHGRCRLSTCIGVVSAVSGLFWLALGVAMTWINVGWKSAAEPRMTGSDMMAVGFLLAVDALGLSLIASVSAGLVAVLYRRLKCNA